ncbi:hypothetical protein KDW_39390 [Dictyobacter vulcani]|uniref:Uncharacterized protein n=1 Tax=Dictyobacter vulcani TaxID=2607529 RepID=A0A5J4KTM7_9CHLR|nr:hypothetical protein [Dictyobacter vulcani]GER89777.1 hypothetical protein KDW_39390 [Dictyobacter vulcani]
MLTGWLFADMFIVISIIFIASTTLAATPPKSKAVPRTPTPVVYELALKPNPIEFTVFVNADLLIAHDLDEMKWAQL